MHSISIIVITYHRPEELAGALENLRALTEAPQEILVLDNDPAGSALEVTTREPGVRYLSAGENLGVAAGRNYAARQATGDVLVFLDDDARLADPAALTAIRSTLQEKPDVAALALRVRNAFSGEVRKKEYPGRDLRRQEEARYVSYFVGGASVIRRAVFQELGGYDESYFYDGEELEFCWRLLRAGWHVFYLPAVEVLHREALTGRTWSGSTRWLVRNRAKTALKHLPWPYLPVYLTVWTGFALLQALRKRGLPGYCEGVASLWKDGILRDALAYRRQHPPSREAVAWMGAHEGRLWY